MAPNPDKFQEDYTLPTTMENLFYTLWTGAAAVKGLKSFQTVGPSLQLSSWIWHQPVITTVDLSCSPGSIWGSVGCSNWVHI